MVGLAGVVSLYLERGEDRSTLSSVIGGVMSV